MQNAGNYAGCSISAADSQKVAHLPNPEGLLEIATVALSRKFMLETAVGLFGYRDSISFTAAIWKKKGETQYFDISSYANNRNAGDNFILGYVVDRISNYRNNAIVGMFLKYRDWSKLIENIVVYFFVIII